MAKRKAGDSTSDGAASAPAIKNELPVVESPSIDPAVSEPPVETVTPLHEPEVASPTATVVDMTPPPVAPSAATPPDQPRFVLSPRRKRMALLAASVTLAAALGTMIGAVATGGFSATAPQVADVTALEERKAMQQSIAHLSKQLTTLKANIEAANKAASMHVAKMTERFEPSTEADVTGSISAPQTVAPQTIAPLPQPRPEPRIAAVETQAPAKPKVVQDWTIRDARGGLVYVEGRGEIYQVEPGAPLPGVGVVEAVRRQDGRWVVVTPKGLIVSMRDRRYFEQF
jgi:hypothetical protein